MYRVKGLLHNHEFSGILRFICHRELLNACGGAFSDHDVLFAFNVLG